MPIDWNEIKSEFVDLRFLLENMPAAFSEQELEAHKVREKLGINSVLDEQFAWGFRAYFGSPET